MATFAAGFPLSGEDDPPSVEAVGFSSSLPVAVTGSLSGALGVWDLPTQRLRQQLQHEVGQCVVWLMQSLPLSDGAPLCLSLIS